jgi:predicted nuclease with TOPRIM domain
MDLTPFSILKEKIDILIRNNNQLREQQEIQVKKLQMREGEIERLNQRCLKYEQQKEQANDRITQLIKRLNDLGKGI